MGGWNYLVLHGCGSVPFSRRHSTRHLWQGDQIFSDLLKVYFFSFAWNLCKLDLNFGALQIVNNPLTVPIDMNPLLRSLLEGLLCKGQPLHLYVTIYQQLQTLISPSHSCHQFHFDSFPFAPLALQIPSNEWRSVPRLSILGLLGMRVQYQSFCAGAGATVLHEKAPLLLNLRGTLMWNGCPELLGLPVTTINKPNVDSQVLAQKDVSNDE